jgi:hypothetical protein
MDFICPECGHQNHYDGFFAYNIRCAECKSVFEMSTEITVKKVTGTPDSCSGIEINDNIYARLV